jgi:hypothetical protein
VRDVAWLDAGRALSCALGEVVVWDPATGARLEERPLIDCNPQRLAVSPAGDRVVVGADYRVLVLPVARRPRDP